MSKCIDRDCFVCNTTKGTCIVRPEEIGPTVAVALPAENLPRMAPAARKSERVAPLRVS